MCQAILYCNVQVSEVGVQLTLTKVIEEMGELAKLQCLHLGLVCLLECTVCIALYYDVPSNTVL